MKNIQGKTKNLELFDKNGKKVCKYKKDSDGFLYEYTYDDKGNELTYKDSDGFSRGFDVPEYTMEELVSKLGNFKIKT